MQQLQSTTTGLRGYSADTEILTRRGWKLFPELDDCDQVATRSPGGLFEWQRPMTRESSRRHGPMVEFRTKVVDLLVTPDHPMLVRRPIPYGIKHPYAEGLDWHMRPASEIARVPEMRWIVPATADWRPAAWPEEFAIPGWEADRRHPADEHATKWLASYLTQPWTPSAQVIAARKAADIGEHAYMAARKNLGIRSRRISGATDGRSQEVSAPTREYAPPGGHYTPMRELRIPMEAFCAFLGLFLAEGWVRKDRNDILIAQFPTSRHMPDIWDILNATGLTWSYSEHVNKFTTSHKTLAPWLRENAGTYAHGKFVAPDIKDLPAHMLSELLRGAMMGDGHWGPYGQQRYTTTSAQLAVDVQEIFTKLGRDSWIRYETNICKRTGEIFEGTLGLRKRQTYVVRERVREFRWLPKPVWREYSGTVHHVTVPNGLVGGLVYVRREGRPAWCT